MTDTHPIPTTPGLIEPWIAAIQVIGFASADMALQRATLRRTDYLATGTVVAELLNPADAALQLTLGNNVGAVEVTGSLAFAAGDPIRLRVVSADSSSMNLGGSFTVQAVGSAGATGLLTTLARVKTFLEIGANTGHDALLTDLIAGVSAAIEAYTSVKFASTAYVGELHDITTASWKDVATYNWPILSIEEVRHNAVVLDAATYKVVYDRMIRNKESRFGIGELECDYTAGFQTIPADITTVATAEVAMAFKQSAPGGDRIGRLDSSYTGQTAGQYRDWQFAPFTLVVLDAYKRIR